MGGFAASESNALILKLGATAVGGCNSISGTVRCVIGTALSPGASVSNIWNCCWATRSIENLGEHGFAVASNRGLCWGGNRVLWFCVYDERPIHKNSQQQNQ